MKFGGLPPSEALGAINVHTLRAGERVIKKGRVLTADDLAALANAGVTNVVCARVEVGELAEDVAAARLATALAGEHITIDEAHTGRANLRAAAAGVFVVDRDAIGRVNVIDEAITFATVPADSPVGAGDIVAPVKIILFGVATSSIAAACEAASIFSIASFEMKRAGLVLTRFTVDVDTPEALAAVRVRATSS